MFERDGIRCKDGRIWFPAASDLDEGDLWDDDWVTVEVSEENCYRLGGFILPLDQLK